MILILIMIMMMVMKMMMMMMMMMMMIMIMIIDSQNKVLINLVPNSMLRITRPIIDTCHVLSRVGLTPMLVDPWTRCTGVIRGQSFVTALGIIFPSVSDSCP